MHLPVHLRFRPAALRTVTLIAVALGAWLANPGLAQETPQEPEAPVAIEPGQDELPPPEPATALEETQPPPAAEAQQEPATPVPPEPLEAAPAPSPEPSPEPAPPPPVNRRELVTIGGPSHLRANETAREMVTIMGDAIVDGHVRVPPGSALL
ncbi:MAG: hypothetical protein ACREIA_15590 [Opitutaceae bacterium]